MKKRLSSVIMVSLLLSMSTFSNVDASVAPEALPVYKSGENVSVTTGNNNDMNILIQGGQNSVGTAQWSSFNIGKDASVNVEFSAHNQTSLNYVDATGGVSQIYGKFTNSGCYGCNYAGTGKVILINPNGVLFGDSANVNLNSFTASNLNGTYDKDSRTLSLEKGSNQGDYGIKVMDGAKIYGDKNVAFASNNISIYTGSQISTNTGTLNVDSNGDGNFDNALGKVKLVTADGVNFKYYNNAAVEKISDAVESNDKMLLFVGGDVQSGNIDIRNYSKNNDSLLFTNKAILKAYKAEKGNDGNIWLKSNNKILTQETDLITVNDSDSVTKTTGGNIIMSAPRKVTLNTVKADAVGDIEISATGDNAEIVIGTSSLKGNNIKINSAYDAALQSNSSVDAKGDFSMTSPNRLYVRKTDVNAKNANFNGSKTVFFEKANVKADEEVNVIADDEIYAFTNDDDGNNTSTFKANQININSKKGFISADLDLTKSKTNMNAGSYAKLKLKNVDNRAAGVDVVANGDIEITADGTLSISRVISERGDVTLDAADIISGAPLNKLSGTGDQIKFEDDTDDRALISVRYGTFKTNPDMEVTRSGGTEYVGSDNNIYKVKHNIQYGANGEEKFLLINPRPVGVYEPEPEPDVSKANQSEILSKIPRKPESFNKDTSVKDQRTSFVDVFAAASQIEIEDDN